MRVKNSNLETPIVESVSVVREFIDVFPKDLPEFLPKREINFRIDLLLNTQPIPIPPYTMALSEPKELKE